MSEEVKVEPIVEAVVDPVTEPIVEEAITEPVKSKNDLLRELSKEHGVNLFDAEGITKFKEYQESQKTELEKKQEAIEAYELKESEWQSEKLEYTAKLKASELGISPDKLEDALKLAGGNPDNLVEVIKKYPVFKSTDGIKIGITDPLNSKAPTGTTEVEQFMAQNPRYKNYIKK